MNATPTLSIPAKMRFPAWQGAYEAALRESNVRELFKLVEIAEAAILTRRDLLERICGSQAEQRAIDQALQVLLVIKQGQLKFSAGSGRGTMSPAGDSSTMASPWR